jgi:hypothetical protein
MSHPVMWFEVMGPAGPRRSVWPQPMSKSRQLIDQNRQLMRASDNSADWTPPGLVLENGRSDQGGPS